MYYHTVLSKVAMYITVLRYVLSPHREGFFLHFKAFHQRMPCAKIVSKPSESGGQ